MSTTVRAALAACLALALAPPALAEDKPAAPPPPAWTGSLGLGYSLSAGNSTSSSLSLTFEVKHDPKTHNVFKAAGLYLRTDSDVTVVFPDGSKVKESQTTADKATLLLRDEYSLSPRLFAYGEVAYLRDEIALTDYLISPTVGVGYKLVKTDTLGVDVSAGAGGAFQKDVGKDSTSSGAVRAKEELAWQISKTAKLTQNLSGLWKTDDFADALYHFDVAVAASLSKLFDLKVAYLLDYRNKPAAPDLKKNDSAFIAAVVMKF